MKKIKFLFYLIIIGLVVFALDDKHIVKDIDVISYESAHEEKKEQQFVNEEEIKQENIIIEKEEIKQENISEEKEETNVNNTKQNDNQKVNQNNQIKTQNPGVKESNKEESKIKIEEEKTVNQTTTSVKTTSATQVKNEEVDYVQKIKNNNDKLGTLGRLYIPSVNLNVGVNHAQAFGGTTYTAQEVVDKKDSAAYYRANGKYTIADHNYQGFDKINNVKVGDKAYIKNTDGTITILVAKSRFIGENLKYDLVDKNGNSVYEMGGDIIMYTCYKNSKSTIMITLWEIVQN